MAVIKGDATCASIMAASVLAKVHRDTAMLEYDHLYPGYGFADHKGYATASHKRALLELGPSPIHRMSWAPLRALLDLTGAAAARDSVSGRVESPEGVAQGGAHS
jgi:ribonuclease HII